METLQIDMEQVYDLIIKFGGQLILALFTLIIGLWIIRIIVKNFRKVLNKKDVDASLKPFLLSLTSIGLKVLLIVSVMTIVGIKMTSFIAILGAAGLAIGMALSGTLQNFAGGVMILIFKPFQVGDFIEAQGYSGSVQEIQIFNTILTTPDNKTIIIPNGGLSTNSMTNFSKQDTRRVDMKFGIGYGDDIDKAKNIIEDIISSDERVLKDPKYFIAVAELADSSVNFVVRAWVKKEDYWGLHFDTIEKVKKEFDKQNVSIPFPQMDVHVIKE